jgi:hypothetical protein
MQRWTRFTLALAALLPASAWAAQQELCIDSTNDFAAALIQAQGQPLTIKLVQGTYRLDLTSLDGANVFSVKSGTSILGGYTSNTCAARNIAGGNTLLTDNGSPQNVYEIKALGDFTLEGLTFDLAKGFFLDAQPGQSGATVTVRRSVVRSNIASTLFTVNWIGTPGTSGNVHITDVLMHGGTTAGCSLEVNNLSGNLDASLLNDTVLNGHNGICLVDSSAAAGAKFGVYNSIAFGSSNLDFTSNTAAATLIDDTIGTRSNPTLNPAPVGLLTAAPGLDGTYRPVIPSSNSIDSGTGILPGGLPGSDLDGGPRVVGSAVDRGAYESPYDNSTKQVVTNTNDTGAGSLRQAIFNANNTAGANTIQFNIPGGCGPQVIKIDSNFDTISGDTKIEGFSQPGASRNDQYLSNDAILCVILESHNAAGTNGLRVGTGAGAGVNLNVSGMAFSGFSGDAIGLMGGSAHNVTGNHFGGSVGGHGLNPNGTNIRIGAGVSQSLVGGYDPEQLNVIGDATGAGVFIGGTATPANNNQIVGNLIGVGWSNGYTVRANGGDGIEIAGANNTVDFNVIGFNGGAGVEIETANALGNYVTRNFIGVDPEDAPLENDGAGLLIDNSASFSVIGANNIAYNQGAGVRVISGERNQIKFNNIHGNSGLGIDLSLVGVTDNDDDAVGTRWQNFPSISTAIGGLYSGAVSGNLTTTPGTYAIDVYASTACDASGHGEGQTYLGEASVVVPNPGGGGDQGSKNFSVPVQQDYPFSLHGLIMTMTATDSLGNTSEFSTCKPYTDDTVFTDGFDHPQI